MLLRSADLTLDDLQVFTLGGDVFLAAWDGSDSPADAVEIEVEGQRVERRRATLRLPTLTDAARTFVAYFAHAEHTVMVTPSTVPFAPAGFPHISQFI